MLASTIRQSFSFSFFFYFRLFYQQRRGNLTVMHNSIARSKSPPLLNNLNKNNERVDRANCRINVKCDVGRKKIQIRIKYRMQARSLDRNGSDVA